MVHVPNLGSETDKTRVYVMKEVEKYDSICVLLSAKAYVMITVQVLHDGDSEKALFGCSKCDSNPEGGDSYNNTLQASFCNHQFPRSSGDVTPCFHIRSLCFSLYSDLPDPDEDFSCWFANRCRDSPQLTPQLWMQSPPLSAEFHIDIFESSGKKTTKNLVYFPFDNERCKFVVAVLMNNGFLKCLECGRANGSPCKHTARHIPYFKNANNTII